MKNGSDSNSNAVKERNSMLQSPEKNAVSRARGCLLGQLAGDALGSLVEFLRPEEILDRYPKGVREMEDGGTWKTIAGQPTDDSEMALLLARSILVHGTYLSSAARETYLFWLNSNPFDCGNTIAAGLRGTPSRRSQANGAMMRISPLGIFGAGQELIQVAQWAVDDAVLTHPHPICQQANELYCVALSHAIKTGAKPQDLYWFILKWADDMEIEPALSRALTDAAESPPKEYTRHQGWVLTAFQNALWQLLHAPKPGEGVVDTIMRGGDTDTNAAIAGALLGAVHGRDAVPKRWSEKVLTCRPMAGNPTVRRPRPECFWPVDALELAEELFLAGSREM
ncbi:MAG: ADP-ribosylglycohydrolase family protein [Desulfovibrionales bacterium]